MDFEICYTNVKTLTKKYMWVIQNYSLTKQGETLKSSTFNMTLLTGAKLEFYFQAIPNCTHNNMKFLCVGFVLCSEPEQPSFVAHVRVSTKETAIRLSHPNSMNHVQFLKTMLLHDDINGFLPNDTLTLVFQVCVLSGSENTLFLDKSNEKANKICLSFDSNLINNYPKLSDITIHVRGKEFLAHKVILAARSPVFAAMFEHNMQETTNNRLEINDIDQNVVLEMLKYIYTGQVFNLNDIATDLLVAADKYGLESLKFICEKTIYSQVTTENAANLLMIADLTSAKQLKAAVISFIHANATEVINTSGWNKINLMLMTELYSSMTPAKP